MSKWNKKATLELKDVSYHPGDHGYGQLSKSLQRYNAMLGCFEEVPLPQRGADGSGPGREADAPRRSRMKVMVKPFKTEEGEVLAAPDGLPASLAAQQRVARYEEVVEDDGQVVVHVPDSAAGPDGVIRLLQVTNEDGSVHYINADDSAIEEEDFTMEDAMQMVLTEGDPGEEQESAEPHPAQLHSVEEPEAAAASEQESITIKQEAEDPDLAELSGACYVCGQPESPSDVPLTPLMAGLSRHSNTPLAELLADTVQRELTVSTADGLCAACVTLLDQADLPEGPLRKSAARHVRNVLAVRVGDFSAVEEAAVSDAGRKRGRARVGRPSEGAQTGSGDEEWTPALEMKGQRRWGRRPREPPSTPPPEEPKLEHMTDLMAPSENKRSARIAIRKNAYVANAVHASKRSQVIVVPEMRDKYFSCPRWPRRPYRRVNMNPIKGRRGRPKLPNPPENELPTDSVEVDGEVMDRLDGMDLGDAAPAEQTVTEAETVPSRTAERVEESGPILVEDNNPPQETNTPPAETTTTTTTDTNTADPSRKENPEIRHIYVDLHEIPEEEHWKATPGCECLMCTELTDEQRAVLEEDEDFGVTFICQYCDKEVQGRSRLRRHEAICKNPARRPPIRHECNTCHRTFKSARLRDEHFERSGHEKRSPCPVCHKFFHPDFLRIHLNSHSGAFYCRICDTHFSSKATLKGHMYRHSGAKPHKCDVCSKAFRAPSSLFMHKRYHHSDERPYVCNFCPKSFAARSTLRIHVRQHTGDRPFACKLCPKSYTRKSSLTQHLRSHTQERRYACMTCGKRFDNKSYLKVHMNRHLGIRAHPCGRCGRGFYSRPNLLKHMQVLCYKDDYGKPEEEQRRRTEQLMEAARRKLEEERRVQEGVQDQIAQVDSDHLQMHGVELDDDSIQTTEVILAIESIPEDGDLLVGHMVQ